MDPDTALDRMRAAAARILDREVVDQDADDLAEAFEALDGWLRAGGFLPQSWSDLPPTLRSAS
jgi:hypothetical protein